MSTPLSQADVDLEAQVRAYREQIDELSEELAETNRGVVALSLEVETYREHLEDLVAQRTTQLETTQAELQQTNSELLMLTSELDTRIAQRTLQLTQTNSALQAQIEEVDRARAQLRRSAERLELAAQSAGLGIWEWNAATDELVWDDTMLRIYGLPRDQQELLSARRQLLAPDDRAANDLNSLSPLLAQPGFSSQFRITRPDGVERVISGTGRVITDMDGALLRVVGIDQDITERVAAASELDRYRWQLEELVDERTEQLRIATEQANSANVAKSAFLANMSHELRTPMNAILGFADLMRKGVATPEQEHEYLEIISASGKHLLALINDILDMSKIESGRMELEVEPVSVRSLLDEVIALMREPAGRKGLALELKVDTRVPDVVRTDEVKLRQILLNLASNAVKCTSQGQVLVSSTFTPLGSSGDGLLEFAVADTGTGIAPDDLERIFEPFQQVGANTSGTGLGLSISRRFAELMGGRLEVASTLGEGSVFTAVVACVPTDEAPEVDDATMGVVVGLAPGQQVRVLIVEDQTENALLLRTLMEQAGIEASVVDNGAQALDAFAAESPDLIWMDGRMPVMDGLEATRRIRAMDGGADVVIIGVTASVLSDERDTLIEAGMDDVISKPYHSHEIYACLAEHLGTQFRYRDEVEALDDEPTVVTADDLAVIPAGVREDLEEALILLDPVRITAVIERVATVDRGLSERLLSMCRSLRYESILAALDAQVRADSEVGE